MGASIVFWFIAKLLMKHSIANSIRPTTNGSACWAAIISPIREGGTGEIIFSQEGTRHTCGARSETGEALARGDGSHHHAL